LVKDRHPDVLLRICGDGPMRSAFENLSVRLGLKDNVVFSGWLRGQDLQFAMDSSRMLVVPSAWREPFGLVAIEAMMNARPVIVSDRGGLVETIRDGIDGYIYQPGDIFELAAKIDNLLADKNLARQLGDSGRLRALDKFDMSLTAERYLELYKRAIERKNA
jgi:glycosyltransferase involved in cell wall biosynthesis